METRRGRAVRSTGSIFTQTRFNPQSLLLLQKKMFLKILYFKNI